MGWWVTFAVLFLLGLLPLGVSIRYDAGGTLVRLILGPAKLTLVPGKKKENKEKKKTAKKEKSREKPVRQIGKDKPDPAPKQKPEQKAQGGSLLDFLPLVKTFFDFLGDFRRKLRLNNLELKLILAGDDPCDLGINYGRAWAALGNLLPKLERWFVIKKRDLEVECDFEASETRITAQLDLTVTLGRLLGALVRFAFRALKEFLKIKKLRKGGAVS